MAHMDQGCMCVALTWIKDVFVFRNLQLAIPVLWATGSYAKMQQHPSDSREMGLHLQPQPGPQVASTKAFMDAVKLSKPGDEIIVVHVRCRASSLIEW